LRHRAGDQARRLSGRERRGRVRTTLAGWLRRLERAPAHAMLAVVVAAPQLVGGVPLTARLVLAALAVAALGLLLAAPSARALPLRTGTLGLALAALTAWTFLQWVPLPAALADALAPAS